jgi:hypothetical protein
VALDADEVVIAGNGAVYVAPLATALPADVDTALIAAYVELGYLSEDGVTWADGKEVEGVPAWQSFYDIRKYVTSKTMSLELVLRQWNDVNVKLAFGGGSVATITGPPVQYRYEPPAPESIDYRILVVEWQDGVDEYRLVVPRGMVTNEVSSQLARTTPADLPVTFEAVPEGRPTPGQLATQPWYFITNEGAFAP